MTPSREMKHLIMVLATLAIISLVVVTWALTRVSAWIVFHDPVWAQMDREGAELEHGISEAFLVARSFYIPAVEAIVGVVFLFLLWRALSARPKASESHDAA
jgi:hypothetical protein